MERNVKSLYNYYIQNMLFSVSSELVSTSTNLKFLAWYLSVLNANLFQVQASICRLFVFWPQAWLKTQFHTDLTYWKESKISKLDHNYSIIQLFSWARNRTKCLSWTRFSNRRRTKVQQTGLFLGLKNQPSRPRLKMNFESIPYHQIVEENINWNPISVEISVPWYLQSR